MHIKGKLALGLGLLASVATGCAVDADNGFQGNDDFQGKGQAIMGGGVAAEDEYPWMVQLMRFDPDVDGYVHWCGGSLIARRWVLTAAHCLHEDKSPDKPLYPASEFRVTLAEQDYATSDGTEQFIGVENFITHEDYHSPIYTDEDLGCYEYKQAAVNDVGLIELSAPAQLGGGVQIVRLSEGDFDVGDAAWLSGWGASAEGETALKELEAEVVETASCDVRDIVCDRTNTSDEICTHNYASDPANGDPQAGCYGDSGSPWVIKPAQGCVEQIGIHSRGQSMCVGPNVPVRVPSYVPWIHEQIDDVYEAETDMTRTTGNAYAGGWNLYDGNGYGAFTHTFSGGQQQLIVSAAGQNGNGWPTAEVRVGGTVVATIQVTSSTFANYPVTFTAPTGSAQVQVRFTNDYYQNGVDRNLLLDKVTVVNVGHGAGCIASGGAFSADLDVYDDWGAGYCARVHVTNGAGVPTTNWTVVVDTGNSAVNQRWNTQFISGTGQHNVRPIGWNNAIGAGVTNTDTGFCVLRAPGTNTLPTVVSATATY